MSKKKNLKSEWKILLGCRSAPSTSGFGTLLWAGLMSSTTSSKTFLENCENHTYCSVAFKDSQRVIFIDAWRHPCYRMKAHIFAIFTARIFVIATVPYFVDDEIALSRKVPSEDTKLNSAKN